MTRAEEWIDEHTPEKTSKMNERLLYEILNDAYPGEWETDVTFLEGLKFRGDAVNRKRKVVIEIDGGIFPFYITLKSGKRVLTTKGGHSSIDGILRDIKKNNAITRNHWSLLRYTPQQLKDSPHQIIYDVRMTCGISDDPTSTQIDLAGVRQAKIEQVQVRLG